MPREAKVDTDTLLTLVEDIGKIKDFNKRRHKAFSDIQDTINLNRIQAEITMFQAASHSQMGSSDDLVSKFYGRKSDDFNSWVEIFELTANAYNFDDVRKAKLLPAYLRETALQKYKGLDTAVKADYLQMKDALREALKPAEQKRWAQGRLADLKQNDEETVQAFALKLQRLVKLSHPELTDEQRNGMLLTYFQVNFILV